MFQKSVNAGVADDAEEVEIAAGFLGAIDGAIEFRVFVKFASEDLLGDGDGFLIDDASGADVLVTDFAVAHGGVGEADVEAAGVNERARILAHDAIGDGMFREEDCVGVIPFWVGIFSPAITNNDHTRASFSARHSILSKSYEMILLNVS
jgi:hypothetical protein